MSISFCGFDENATVGEIRRAFENKTFCQDMVKTYRKDPVGAFDAIAAIILGGAIAGTKCTSNYCEITYNKKNDDASTWSQALLKWACYDRVMKDDSEEIKKIKKEKSDILKALIKSIEPSNTLKEIYDILDTHLDWKSPEKKEKVLRNLDSDYSMGKSQTQGENNMGNNGDEDIIKMVNSEINQNKQVIFTGAPGTGKTYSVRKCVEENTTYKDGLGNKFIDKKQSKFVQFHPSYDYSDFVEGLRPVALSGQTESTFVRLDGIFKAFCRHIVEENNSEKKYYFVVDEINRADLSKVFGELMFGLEESYRGEKYKFDTQYKNLRTYRILDESDMDNDNIGKAVPIENDVFKDGFYIPENLYFIGTMNDIDRSVESFDFALRRRFQWIEIKANEVMETSLKKMWKDKNIDKSDEWIGNIISMNNVLTKESKYGLTEAYHIGPAYFKDFNGNNMEDIFKYKVEPIIREYLRGRKNDEINELVAKCSSELFKTNP